MGEFSFRPCDFKTRPRTVADYLRHQPHSAHCSSISEAQDNSLLQMGEGRLQQVGDVLLDVRLVVGRAAGAQGHADLPLLYQVEHVGQDGGVHGQTCRQGEKGSSVSTHIN